MARSSATASLSAASPASRASRFVAARAAAVCSRACRRWAAPRAPRDWSRTSGFEETVEHAIREPAGVVAHVARRQLFTHALDDIRTDVRGVVGELHGLRQQLRVCGDLDRVARGRLPPTDFAGAAIGGNLLRLSRRGGVESGPICFDLHVRLQGPGAESMLPILSAQSITGFKCLSSMTRATSAGRPPS